MLETIKKEVSDYFQKRGEDDNLLFNYEKSFSHTLENMTATITKVHITINCINYSVKVTDEKSSIVKDEIYAEIIDFIEESIYTHGFFISQIKEDFKNFNHSDIIFTLETFSAICPN